jgi:hypothetical protein
MKERDMAYQATCEACGHTVSGATREETTDRLEEHNRKMHNMEMQDREKIAQKVHQTA